MTRLRIGFVGAITLALVGAGVVAGSGSRVATPQTDGQVVTASIEFFEAKMATDPWNPLIAGHLAARYVRRFGTEAQLTDIARAEGLARTAIVVSTDRSGAQARLSGILLMQHRFREALDAALLAVAADTGNADAWGATLEAAVAAGDTTLANTAVQKLPGTTIPNLVRRALWLDARGQTNAAIPLQRHACDGLARSAALPVSQAWCLTQLGTLEGAVAGDDAARARFAEALMLVPKYRGARERMAWLAYAGGQVEEAARTYTDLATDAHPDIYLRLAELSEMTGDSVRARAWRGRFENAALGADREALYGPEIVLYWLGQHNPAGADTALAVAEREIARRPTAESWDLLAWVHHTRGATQAALVGSDRALVIGPASPTMLWHRSRILQAVGDQVRADSLRSEALTQPSQLKPHVLRLIRRQAAAQAHALPRA